MVKSCLMDVSIGRGHYLIITRTIFKTKTLPIEDHKSNES